jgi:hypothetical protein
LPDEISQINHFLVYRGFGDKPYLGHYATINQLPGQVA